MIALLDLDSIAYTAGFGNKIIDPQTGEFKRDEAGRLVYVDKTPEEIYTATDQILEDIIRQTNCTEYIGFIKGKSTGKHRYQAKPDYKANRPKESPSFWKTVSEYLVNEWGANYVNDIEVDDAVNIAKNHYGNNSFIVAIDKDLLNLEGSHYNWRTREWVKTSKEDASLLFWLDMLTGQPGDGVKGIPKIGPVSANKLLKDTDDYISKVLSVYINYYGEPTGISEFYKNYSCLKILDSYEDYIIPTPIKIEKEEGDLW